MYGSQFVMDFLSVFVPVSVIFEVRPVLIGPSTTDPNVRFVERPCLAARQSMYGDQGVRSQ